MSFLRALLRWVGGPAPRLPEAIDRAAEHWRSWPPRVRMLLGGLVAVAVIASGAARVALSPWGPPVDVLVANDDLSAGDSLDLGRAGSRRLPAAVLPDDALRAGDLVDGTRVTVPILAGTILTRRHVSGGGLERQVTPGRVAVAVPTDQLPALPAGAVVDLLAGSPDGAGRRLAADARVLGRDEAGMWVEVDREAAPAVAAAIGWGTLTVAVLSGTGATPSAASSRIRSARPDPAACSCSRSSSSASSKA